MSKNFNSRKTIDREGYNRLKAEIEIKEKERKNELAQCAVSANDETNLSENSGYMEHSTKAKNLKHQIDRMTQALQNYEIVEVDNYNNNTVTFGSIVTILSAYTDDEEEEVTYRIVGAEPNSNASITEISKNCPIGKCIFGKTVGYLGNAVREEDGTLIAKVKILSIK